MSAPRSVLTVVGALALLILFAAGSTSRATEIQRVTSAQGIEAWLVEEHSIPLVSLNIAFAGSAALDPEGREGTAHMVSGLLDEGAGDMNALAFQSRLEELAIHMSFSAGHDHFTGSLVTLTENLGEAFALIGLALGEPRFDDDAVERIRKQIIFSLRQSQENPGRIAGETWSKHIFGDDPYGRPSQGFVESVAAITAGDLRAFAGSRFVRAGLTVGVVGDIDAEELARLLDTTFGGLPAGDPEADPFALEAEVHADGAFMVIRKDYPQSVVKFGHRGIKRNHPDWYAAYVMNYILGGGGFASRLMDEVREKRGLAYSVYSYLQPYKRGAVLAGGVATANERVRESIDLIRSEIRRYREDGPTEEELRNAKTYMTGSYALNLDSNRKLSNLLVRVQTENLGIDYINRRNDYIEAVTLADVQRLAREILDPDNLVVVVVGDPVGLDEDLSP